MCGWPPRCKSFVWAMRDKSAACMCPAYIRRHIWPPAQMRSADRVHYKLSRSRRLQVCWMSRSRLSTIASSSHSAPFHHDRQDPACPCGRFLCCPVRLLPSHYCPDYSSHLVGRATAASLIGLRAIIRPSQLSAKFSLLRDHRIVGHGAYDEEPADDSVTHLRDPAQPLFAAVRVLTRHQAKPRREVAP